MRAPTLLLSLVILVLGVLIGIRTWQKAPKTPFVVPQIEIRQPEPYTGPKPIERSVNPNEVSGYVLAVEEKNGAILLTIDEAELFLVEHSTEYTNGVRLSDAGKAALEDRGLTMPNTQEELNNLSLIPTPFYIRNNSTTTRQLVLASTAKIRVHKTQAITRTMTAKQFAREFNLAQINNQLMSLMEFSSLFHMKLRNNVITDLQGDASP